MWFHWFEAICVPEEVPRRTVLKTNRADVQVFVAEIRDYDLERWTGVTIWLISYLEIRRRDKNRTIYACSGECDCLFSSTVLQDQASVKGSDFLRSEYHFNRALAACNNLSAAGIGLAEVAGTDDTGYVQRRI